MKFLMIVALAAALPLQATTALATDAASASATLSGQKIDSGLGELPHYRLWADSSGKNPMALQKAAKAVNEVKAEKAPLNADAKAAAPAPTRVAGLK